MDPIQTSEPPVFNRRQIYRPFLERINPIASMRTVVQQNLIVWRRSDPRDPEQPPIHEAFASAAELQPGVQMALVGELDRVRLLSCIWLWIVSIATRMPSIFLSRPPTSRILRRRTLAPCLRPLGCVCLPDIGSFLESRRKRSRRLTRSSANWVKARPYGTENTRTTSMTNPVFESTLRV